MSNGGGAGVTTANPSAKREIPGSPGKFLRVKLFKVVCLDLLLDALSI